MQQRQLRRNGQVGQSELLTHQIGLSLHQRTEMLKVAAQLFQTAVVDHLSHAAENPAWQTFHQGTQW